VKRLPIRPINDGSSLRIDDVEHRGAAVDCDLATLHGLVTPA
jgi:hypothetical protein